MTNDVYEASKWGYSPHSRQSRLFCPKCGSWKFESFPQSVNAEAEYWCYEFHCINCGWIVGIDVKRD